MHQQADMSRWQGRVDAAEGELGKRWHQVVTPLEDAPGPGGVALVGFACDAGVARNHGRTGARGGPAALRAMLGNMPVQRCRAIADAGDVVCVADGSDDGLERAQQELADVVAGVLERGKLPVAMGGGHEIAFASFSGLARHLAAREQAPRIGIINLDAHFDLRMAERGSSGTPFRQIAEQCQARGWPFHYCVLGINEFGNTQALFERARALGVRWMLDEEMHVAALDKIRATLADFLAQVDHVYFTVCLDVLAAAIAPGVSAPSPRGIGLDVVDPVIDIVAGSGKLRLADFAELNPGYDIDNRTARVAARLLARIVERSNA
ncbi:MAG TPA: formimidoylglutamase [Noviherbaspirillum sp.]|uniref:formimidoylglutamase n=1 Tax=Noviherbaspirillum sp. TaxID=1926288 RepID=UPI002D650047|nr:formimidoylglutamase [Noviherbaspirillum sp.]HYD97585.1 formimidoylglutamase [Noviherbaspirillum sp.]